MVKKVTLSDLRKAVIEAYEEYKDLDKGSIDPRNKKAKADDFGIAVMLTDGRTADAGNADALSPLGSIASVPVHAVLLQQNDLKSLIKKAGKTISHKLRKLDLPVSPHALRAMSAVQPTGDSVSKYDIVEDTIVSMSGSAPVLDDALYDCLLSEARKAEVENKLAEVDYELYDNAAPVISDFTRLEALTVSPKQLAALGATIAADGRNPVSGQPAFDGSVSAPLTTLIGIHGNPDRNRRWLLKSGVPAVFSFGGLVLAVMPGVGAIAAYAPAVCKHGRSKKGSRAVRYITRAIGYNIFGSDYIKVE